MTRDTKTIRTLDAAITAFGIAYYAHMGQTRANGKTPYLIHPLRVTKRVEELYHQEDRDIVFCAAMTHDVLEDSGKGKGSTKYDYDGLSSMLCPEVANIVKELTQDESLPKEEKRAKMIEHCKTMSPQARFIKLADRLDNMLEMGNMSASFVARYCREARQMVANMQGTCPEMEQQILDIANRYEQDKSSSDV